MRFRREHAHFLALKSCLQQTQLLAFEFQKFLLCGEAAAKTREAAVAADHAMARNDDGDGIAAVRQADGTDSLGIADALSELQVGNRLSVRNPTQRIPDSQLKL